MAKTYMTEYFVNAFSDLRWNLREYKTLCNLSVTGGTNFCDLILCEAFQWLMAKTFTKYVSSTRRNLASNNSACIVDSRKLIYFYFGSLSKAYVHIIYDQCSSLKKVYDSVKKRKNIFNH